MRDKEGIVKIGWMIDTARMGNKGWRRDNGWIEDKGWISYKGRRGDKADKGWVGDKRWMSYKGIRGDKADKGWVGDKRWMSLRGYAHKFQEPSRGRSGEREEGGGGGEPLPASISWPQRKYCKHHTEQYSFALRKLHSVCSLSLCYIG